MNKTQGNLALMPVIPTILEVPEEKIIVLANDAESLLKAAKEQKVITTKEQFDAVNAEIVRIKNVRKQVEALFKDSKEWAYKTHKEICAAEKKLLDPLDQAEKQYNPLLIAYTREQERKAREEAERLRREAEEKARAEAEAERQRLLAEAEQKMDSGADLEEVDSIVQAAETVEVAIPVIPVPTFTAPKPVGLTIADNWTFEIINPNLIPREYLMPDEKKILGVAKATKGTVQIPGVRIYNAGSVRKAR